LASGKNSTFLRDDLSTEELRNEAKAKFSSYLRYLAENKELQEIHRWELMEKNPITEMIARRRGQFGQQSSTAVAKVLNQSMEGLDTTVSLIVGGIIYLVLLSKIIDQFNSLDFSQSHV